MSAAGKALARGAGSEKSSKSRQCTPSLAASLSFIQSRTPPHCTQKARPTRRFYATEAAVAKPTPLCAVASLWPTAGVRKSGRSPRAAEMYTRSRARRCPSSLVAAPLAARARAERRFCRTPSPPHDRPPIGTNYSLARKTADYGQQLRTRRRRLTTAGGSQAEQMAGESRAAPSRQ